MATRYIYTDDGALEQGMWFDEKCATLAQAMTAATRHSRIDAYTCSPGKLYVAEETENGRSLLRVSDDSSFKKSWRKPYLEESEAIDTEREDE